MLSKFVSGLVLSEAILLLLFLTTPGHQAADNSRQQQQSSDHAPLAGLDKLIRQSTGNTSLDTLIKDQKLPSNVTNIFTELTNNLKKLINENKRLSDRVKQINQRVQTMAGINATNVANSLQKQGLNTTGLPRQFDIESLLTVPQIFLAKQ